MFFFFSCLHPDSKILHARSLNLYNIEYSFPCSFQLEWLSTFLAVRRQYYEAHDTALYDRFIVSGREDQEEELTYLARRTKKEVTGKGTNSYPVELEKYKEEKREFQKQTPDVPSDFVRRLAVESSAERLTKWIIKTAAEGRGRRHLPLKAIGFMLTIGIHL